MGTLFKKPANMKWVDLAIWIDNNFYKEGCDYNTAYTYIWLLGYMLASKRRYFNNQKDYEDFASALAYTTYQRMSNTNKAPVKSVLNYMKSVLSFRRTAFNVQRRQKIIDPQFDEDWDSMSYIERCKSSYEASNRGDLFEGVSGVLKDTPKIIFNSIPRVYRGDKVEFENIYISCLLSMLNRVTLPNSYNEKFEKKFNESVNFDEVKFYKRYLDNDVILWNLPDHMSNVIAVVLNKTNNKIINEVKELSDDIKITDYEFTSIMSSGFISGGANETDY